MDRGQRAPQPSLPDKDQPVKPEEAPLGPLPLPLPQPPPPGPRPGAGPRFLVREILFTGNTAFSDRDLAPVIAPYLNKELTTEDVESLRLAVTVFYVNKGYITSGAVVPDQEVKDGVLRLQIIEGKLSSIDLEGNRWFRSSYLRDRIELGIGPPLNMTVLQERLQLLQQDGRIEQLNAELRPGLVRGESELHVKVKEANPFHAWLEFNNYQTPVVGAERGIGTVSMDNLTGHGDPFTFSYGGSEGVNPLIYTSYQIPLNRWDTSLLFEYRRNDFVVVEQQFQGLNISAQAEIIGVTLRQPIVRTLNHEFVLAVQGEHLYNKTFLLGQPFDFVAGQQNGVANDSALRFIQEYTYRTQASVIAARSRFSVGLNVLGATITPSTPGNPVADGQFFAWLGQLQAVHRLDRFWGIQLLGRLDAQLANDRLFPLEQVPVGGRFSVRGYRENTLVRDNALMASFETRIPILRRANGEDMLQLAPFVDYGRAYNNEVPDPAPNFLASVGVGLRWSVLPRDRAHFEIYWGQQLNHFQVGEGNLQDHGIHLQFVVQAL